jgi:hypothetical protein
LPDLAHESCVDGGVGIDVIGCLFVCLWGWLYVGWVDSNGRWLKAVGVYFMDVSFNGMVEC